MNNQSPFISIIVPVYNDNKGLENCLQAIRRQQTHLSQTEVIVVDNASTSSPESLVNQFSFAKYAYEKKAGSYAARNKGMSIATGEYLVFLDADCIPEPDWLEKGVECLQQTDSSTLIGGNILFTLSKKPTTTELYQYIVGFQQEENIEDKSFSATANLFIKKEDALKIGEFEERLLSGGDRNWCWRAVEKGIQVKYSNNAIVKTKPRRLLSNAIKQTRRVAGGRYHAQALGLYKEPTIKQRQAPHRSNWQSVIWIFQQSELSYVQRFQVFFVASLLKSVAIVERWRLRFGAKADRD
jgi:glycosyltransferase involved in cell wall biosynthesis